eukprot:Sspe_Gene.118336::Locus_111598_Transcript_1_1_Confidence_1.000_Length_629::g.118336::m.118336
MHAWEDVGSLTEARCTGSAVHQVRRLSKAARRRNKGHTHLVPSLPPHHQHDCSIVDLPLDVFAYALTWLTPPLLAGAGLVCRCWHALTSGAWCIGGVDAWAVVCQAMKWQTHRRKRETCCWKDTVMFKWREPEQQAVRRSQLKSLRYAEAEREACEKREREAELRLAETWQGANQQGWRK